ncbi:MAG: retropepsin-like aspartic protease, partial [Sedimenticola sp.]
MAKPPVVVRELKGMSLVVDIVVNGHQTEAVVDTAATITLVSDKFYSSLPQSGKSIGNVVLKGLADVPVNGKLVPNMNIRLGYRNYKWNVCVAPMSDNVILGIDFLKAYAGLVDFGRNVVAIDGQILPAKLKVAATDDQIHISRVHICKRVVIPPETIGFVQCSVDSHPPTGDTYIFQPLPAKNGALISSVYASGTTFNVKVVNDSNTFMTFKKDRLIGL